MVGEHWVGFVVGACTFMVTPSEPVNNNQRPVAQLQGGMLEREGKYLRAMQSILKPHPYNARAITQSRKLLLQL